MNRINFCAKPYFSQLIASIKAICEENYVDDTHGLAHARKIGELTQQALERQQNFRLDDEERENIVLAGYLHDIDDRKYFKTQGYENAVKVLKEINIQNENISKIVLMIELVSFAKNGNKISAEIPIAYYIPRYIDRSEAIGLEGLYRSYLYAVQKSPERPVCTNSTPKPTTQAQAFEMAKGRDIQYMKTGFSISLVDHFFDKLIHIELPKEINQGFLKEFYWKKKKEMIDFVIEHSKTDYVHYKDRLLEIGEKL